MGNNSGNTLIEGLTDNMTEEKVSELIEKANKELNLKMSKLEDINKKLQSNFDRVNTEKQELKQSLEEIKKQQMDEQQRIEYERQQKEIELQRKDEEIRSREIELLKRDMLVENNIDLKFKKFIIGNNKDEIKNNIENFKLLFDGVVQKTVEDKFKITGNNISKIIDDSDIEDKTLIENNPFSKKSYNLTKQIELQKENPELAKKLKKIS